MLLAHRKFRIIKPEIRVVGIDDGAFIPHVKGSVPVIGVVFRGGFWLDGVMCTQVEVDGLDATERIASMILESPHYRQLRVIMTDGVTFAGFNVLDIKKLHEHTKLPVMAVTREKPNFQEIRKALQNLPKSEERWRVVRDTGDTLEAPSDRGKQKVYMQFAGILKDDAIRILRMTSTRSNIPEALRVAHLIASGISM